MGPSSCMDSRQWLLVNLYNGYLHAYTSILYVCMYVAVSTYLGIYVLTYSYILHFSIVVVKDIYCWNLLNKYLVTNT